ncbi:MAG: High-affnity carbon uptake protein Hat/HatR [uncultured Aureispira sp.]|uniref:High-affnity carbon uptake protein Hat/HatR n=1 Tax=uncultured Aureispira sp. TaxID=1331704 RepID=A0A6S6SUR1_9BACT|nr:MAG: High-affnity carbon uptake protein Hat/HatR [uncultured Aureispira sp.]
MRLFNLIFLLLSVLNTSIGQVEIKSYTKYISSPSNSAISEDGNYYYVAHGKGLGIYKINPQTKLLENIQEIKIERGATNLILTPDNQYVIRTGYSEAILVVYKRNASDGKLSLYKKYTQTKDGKALMNKVSDFAISPSGRYLFLESGRTLMTLRFEDGGISYVEEHVLKGSYHGTVTFSPDNKHVFIENYHFDGNSHNTILTLDETTGKLQVKGSLSEDYLIPGTTFYIYGEKRQYNVSPILEYMAFSPDGKDVYMEGSEWYPNGSRGAFMHYRWINGKLTLQKAYYKLPPTFQIETMKNIYLDGSGGYLYILTGGEASGVHVFKRNEDTGALTFVKSFFKKNNLPRIVTPYRASFSPDNQHVYISSFFGGNIITLENKGGKPSPKKSKPNNNYNQEPKPVVHHNSGNNSSNNSNNSNASQTDCQHTQISTTEITRIEERLMELDTEQARYDYALKAVQNRCLATLQVLKLARLFEVEYMRLEFVKFAYYYTSDLDNFYLLDTLFTNDRLKQAFKKSME